MAYVISVLSEKGGVGKTTISTNLTYAFNLFGFSPLLVDSDPMGSARNWHEANGGMLVTCVGCDRATLAQDVRSMAEDYDVIIIDGAPRIEKLISAAIKISDVVLLPILPSQYDVWATADLMDMIKDRQQLMDGTPSAAFILNQVRKRGIIDRETVQVLNDTGIPVLETQLSFLIDYKKSVPDGRSVFCSAQYVRAAEEINRLFKELIEKYFPTLFEKFNSTREPEVLL